MTEPHYNHPGEVREAMNFQCLHCPKIFTAPQGLDHHLVKVHGINLDNFQFKKDWDVTAETAADHTPIVGRKPSTITYSGDRRMKSRDEQNLNLKCSLCNKVYSSSAGISQHHASKHNQGSKKGVNWEWTSDPVTFKNIRAELSQQRKGLGATTTPVVERSKPRRIGRPRKKAIVLTPDQGYIEIPAVIRVPISVGQAVITQS